ncbi:MAG: Holliday junction branch migration protein RuvA [Acidimicrobiales bacterium]
MIGSLRGAVIDRPAAGEVVVETGGVGYRVSVPPQFAQDLVRSASPVLIYVHTHVREDAIVLYGFAHADERRCFEALLGAHGVGPSLAMAILSSLSPATLSTAVLEDDVDTLCRVPGVGKKTAARLLLELEARFGLPSLEEEPGQNGGVSPHLEARAALLELGYQPEEVRGALEAVGGEAPVEELIRSALRQLAHR